MKSHILSITAPAVFFWAVLTAPALQAQDADDLMDRFLEAWNTEDRRAMAEMLDEQVIYWSTERFLEGREQVLDSWHGSMQAVDEMRLSQLRSNRSGGAAFHAGEWEQLAGDRTVAKGAYTFGFSRGEDGEWRIVSAHVEDADLASERTTEALEIYKEELDGDHTDAGRVPLAENVILETPQTRDGGEPMRGAEEVRAFMNAVSPNMPRFEVERYVIDGNVGCAILEWESAGGLTVPTVNCYGLQNGKIQWISINFDRLPLQR